MHVTVEEIEELFAEAATFGREWFDNVIVSSPTRTREKKRKPAQQLPKPRPERRSLKPYKVFSFIRRSPVPMNDNRSSGIAGYIKSDWYFNTPQKHRG